MRESIWAGRLRAAMPVSMKGPRPDGIGTGIGDQFGLNSPDSSSAVRISGHPVPVFAGLVVSSDIFAPVFQPAQGDRQRRGTHASSGISLFFGEAAADIRGYDAELAFLQVEAFRDANPHQVWPWVERFSVSSSRRLSHTARTARFSSGIAA